MSEELVFERRDERVYRQSSHWPKHVVFDGRLIDAAKRGECDGLTVADGYVRFDVENGSAAYRIQQDGEMMMRDQFDGILIEHEPA